MKEVALDTETTGLDVADRHRIIEIGCVEMISGRRTGRIFHAYVNPERAVSVEALKVHGLKDDFLRDQALFSKIADDFLNFIKDARLIIHNAAFDLAFLNAELKIINRPVLENQIIDTLILAREKFPNQSNRLDALCQRFGIDISQRTKHGALLDAGLLAEVYIALSAGEQASLLTGAGQRSSPSRLPPEEKTSPAPHPPAPRIKSPSGLVKQPRLTKDEITAHQAFIKNLIGKNALWGVLCDIKHDINYK